MLGKRKKTKTAAFAKRRRLEVRSGLFTSQLASSRISQNIRLYFPIIFQTINEVLENAFLEEKSPATKICSFVVNGQCVSRYIDYLYTSDSETNISEDN